MNRGLKLYSARSIPSLTADFQRVDAIAAATDGETFYLIDRDSSHLGVLDLSGPSPTFTDRGAITDLPNLSVLAAVGPSEDLWVASNSTNSLYTIDVDSTPPVAALVTELTGVDVNGADIAFGSDGTLYLHSNSDDTLYTVDYTGSGTRGQATPVGGAVAGVSLTGLAVRDNGSGDLVGSSRIRDAIVVINKDTGASGTEFPMTLNGSSYDYLNGDMTLGVLEPTCGDCTDSGLLAKYEFACVETDPETGECVAWDFVFETGDDSAATYTEGSFEYENKDGELWEPMSATFGTEYCTVYAVVKAGRELEVQELNASNGEITASCIASHAISFVAFFCTEAEADAFAGSFPSNGGRGRSNRA